MTCTTAHFNKVPTPRCAHITRSAEANYLFYALQIFFFWEKNRWRTIYDTNSAKNSLWPHSNFLFFILWIRGVEGILQHPSLVRFFRKPAIPTPRPPTTSPNHPNQVQIIVLFLSDHYKFALRCQGNRLSFISQGVNGGHIWSRDGEFQFPGQPVGRYFFPGISPSELPPKRTASPSGVPNFASLKSFLESSSGLSFNFFLRLGGRRTLPFVFQVPTAQTYLSVEEWVVNRKPFEVFPAIPTVPAFHRYFAFLIGVYSTTYFGHPFPLNARKTNRFTRNFPKFNYFSSRFLCF